jgi:hypothetical protein
MPPPLFSHHPSPPFIARLVKVAFTHDDAFCGSEGAGDESRDKCATYVVSKEAYRKDYGLKQDEIIVAVKTTGSMCGGV